MDPVPHPELFNTLLALLAISLASLFGSISFAFGKRLQIILPYLLAAASGILLSAALTHLLPEAIEHLRNLRKTMLLLLAGLLGSFILERVFAIGLHHSDIHQLEAGSASHSMTAGILVSGAVHSFVDGVAIAAAFAVGHQVGIVTTAAVFLHEVPHHVANVSVLIYTGMNRGRATVLNLAATSGCAVGGVLVLFGGFHSPSFTFAILPIAAANFLYVALSILIPELNREKDARQSLLQMISLLLAASGMAALSAWEPL